MKFEFEGIKALNNEELTNVNGGSPLWFLIGVVAGLIVSAIITDDDDE